MNLESRVTWQKISLELELLNTEDPNSLVPLVIGLNSLLNSDCDQERTHRAVNFMTYELISKAQDYSEGDRLQILNDYFFGQKSFQFSMPDECAGSESELLIEPILQSKKGEPLPLSILYQHFANNMDLPIYLVNMNSKLVLKWVRGAKSSFLHLLSQGRVLKSEELSALIQTEKDKLGTESESCVEILPNRQIFKGYVERLLGLYKADQDLGRALALLDVSLVLNPHCLDSLAHRGLIRQQLGHVKEALCDFKKYFSFVEPDHAPKTIQVAFRQLKSIEKLNSIPGEKDLLH